MPLARSFARLVTAAALLVAAAALTPDDPPAAQESHPGVPEPGVPQALAADRARRLSDLRYHLTFTVPAERSARIAGHVSIRFTLTDLATALALDFEPGDTSQVSGTLNGRAVAPPFAAGHIMLPVAALRAGENELQLDFTAGDAPLNRSDDFLYTIFVPARAHETFPAFDQPDLKARWTLSLDVPEGWQTLGNAAETARTSAKGRTRVSFAETQPISTYLFAFAAGKFSIETGQRSGRTFRIFHRETDAQKVARNRDVIFDLHASALGWLEHYTGIPYPFGKFDMLLVPAFQFGGMEHPGALFYNATGQMLDESATQNQLLERASTIAHETAHMWFGNLVTMRWFTDVWMKEVFANFMAAKIVNPLFPGINHELRFLHAHYPAAYDVDRTAGTNAIRQPLDNLKDAGTLYGAIVYQKAPIVMRQLETLTGENTLRDALREYLRTYSFRNASWPDLIAILDKRTPDDLATWSRTWVEEAGRPILQTALDIADGRITALTITQRDPDPARGLTWTQDVQVLLGYNDGTNNRLFPVRLTGARTEMADARGRPAPSYVLLNGGGRAYGEVHLDPFSLSWLSGSIDEVADPLTRGSAWVTLWDAVVNSKLPAPRFVDLIAKALPRESNELNVQQLLGYLGRAFWVYLSPAERLQRIRPIEQLLRNGLTTATTVSLRSSYFSALRDMAGTPATLDWLTRVWGGDVTVDGLPLAENDFIVLSEELAVRGVRGWKEILDGQIARTLNPDRKARLQFVAPALSSDAAERDRFFASLADAANRRREPWVLDGLHYLHHPLRADVSLRYILPSLALLQEIQQTGDIFFPKRWMDSTLGGHQSPEAAQIVRAFLENAGPAYPTRLRRTILASADDLFRASTAGRR